MRKLCLIIIDGFGVAPPGPGNARTLANMPTITRLEKETSNVIMQAAGNAAGLPDGQQGASEPGHLTIGAGRIVWQPLEEINQAIHTGLFFENSILISACKRAVERHVPLHLMGIYSQGGVHGHADHWRALIELTERHKVERVVLHLIGDGRDVPKQQFCEDHAALLAYLKGHPSVKVASLIGRYYAMDRDKQYATRTKPAYDLYTQGVGNEVKDLCSGAQAWYAKAPEKEQTDYYVRPLKTPDFLPMRSGDVVIGVNFRTDRMYQMIAALEQEDFAAFKRTVRITDVVCMGPYSKYLPVAFPAQKIRNTLVEAVSSAGGKILKIAETDKWAHTTFFFNGQREEPFPGEERILIESPKVPNFASTPRMSADKLTDRLIQEVSSKRYDFIVVNYANPDLVGHGGVLEAEILACEAVDENIGRLLPMLERNGYDWIVTADHGNAEEKYFPGTTQVSPSHTKNPVQTFVHSDKIPSSASLKGKTGIKDIAPLCLQIMELPVPAEMK